MTSEPGPHGRSAIDMTGAEFREAGHALVDEIASFYDSLRARRVTEQMALALQASLLVRHAPHAVADAFCVSRLGGDHGSVYGTLPTGCDLAALIARAGRVS